MRYGREISVRNPRTQESHDHTQTVRSFLYGTQERVYESLGKTTLIFLFVYCVYRYDRRMVNNLLYHKCPIISRGRGSLNEFRQ